MAFIGSPSSQHQHCTDEAQKAETVLSAVIYIKEIKNAPSALLSYISTREFLRTRALLECS